jgi:hypothetical protein
MLTLLLTSDPSTLDWTWLTQGGAIGVLAAVVIGFVRGWIVPGPTHKRALDELSRAMDLLYSQAENAHRTAEIARQAAEIAIGQRP